MHVRKFAVAFLYVISIAISMVFGNKENIKRMPGANEIQQMLRYSRSSNGKISVYPRADVFYLGPRYGKRSSVPNHLDSSISTPNCIEDKSYPCTYTGISNLYRCNNSRRTVDPNRF